MSALEFGRSGSLLLARSHFHLGFAALVFGLGRMGFNILALDFVAPEPSLLVQSMAQPGSPLLVLDFFKLGLSLLLRARFHIGLAMFVTGLSCVGFVFSLLVIESTMLGPALSPRSAACLELCTSILDYGFMGSPSLLRSLFCGESFPSVLDLAHLDFLLFVQSPAWFGSMLLASDPLHSGFLMFMHSFVWPDFSVSPIGLQCMGSVFALSVVECLQLGLVTSLRSCGQLELATLVLDFLHLGPSMLPRSFCQIGFTSLAMQLCRTELVVLVLDFSSMGSVLPARSFVCSGLAILIPDLTHFDLLMLVHAVTRSNSALSTCGVQSLGSLFFLSVVDCAYPGLSFSLQSSARLDPVLLVLDSLHSGFFSFPRSISRFGLSVLAFDFLKPDFPPLLRSSSQMDLLVFLLGLSCCGFVSSSSAVEHAHLELLSPSRSLARFGSMLLVLDLLHMDSPLFFQSHTCQGPSLPPWGLTCLGLVSPLSVIECTSLGLVLSIRSMVRSDLAALVSDSLHLGLASLLRSHAWIDLMTLVFGKSQFELNMLVLDLLHLGLPPPLRSLGHFGPSTLVLDLLHLGLTVFLHEFTQADLPLSLPGLARAGFVFFLLVISMTKLESSLFLRSRIRMGFVSLVFDLLHLGLLLLMRSPGRTDLIMLLWGLSRLGFVFSLSVVDTVNLDSLLLPRSLAQLEFTCLVLKSVHLGLASLPRSPNRLESVTLVFGLGRFDPLSPTLDHVTSEPFSSVRAVVQLGLAALVSDFLHLALPLLSRSFGHGDSMPLAFGLTRLELLSSLSVIETGALEPFLSAQSFAQLELQVSVFNFVKLGSSSFPRSFAQAGLVPFVSSSVRSDSSLLILDASKPEPSSSARSMARPALGLSAFDFLHLGSSSSFQSLA